MRLPVRVTPAAQIDAGAGMISPRGEWLHRMGRMHDESLSACVRYLGGQKDVHKTVIKDLIADELSKKIRPGKPVEAGQVVVTSAGALAKSHKVKAIFHAAAMNGEPSRRNPKSILRAPKMPAAQPPPLKAAIKPDTPMNKPLTPMKITIVVGSMNVLQRG